MWFTVHQSKALMFINLFLPEMQTEKIYIFTQGPVLIFQFWCKRLESKNRKAVDHREQTESFQKHFQFSWGV